MRLPAALDGDGAVVDHRRNAFRPSVEPDGMAAHTQIDHPIFGILGFDTLGFDTAARRTGKPARNMRSPRHHPAVGERRDRHHHRPHLVGQRPIGERIAEFLGNKAGGQAALGEARSPEDRIEEADIVGEAAHLVAVQRIAHGGDGRSAVRPVGDQLRDHGVVEDGDLRALFHARVDAYGSAFLRLPVAYEPPRGRHEAAGRVFRIDTAFKRPAVPPNILLNQSERLAGGDTELLLHQVEPGNHLRYRMLHLEPRVHLEEVEIARLVGDELDRSRRDVVHRTGQRHGLCAHCGASLLVQKRARGLLDHFLVAPLDGAFALAEMDHVPRSVGEDLNLHMARILDEALDEHPPVSERGLRLMDGRADARGELILRPHQPHALSTAAGGRLYHHGIADVPGGGLGTRRSPYRVLGAGNHGHARFYRDTARGDLVAHGGDGSGRRPDEDDTRPFERLDERRVLRKEAVAGMHRLRTGAPGRVDQRLHVQVALRRRRGADGDRFVRHSRMESAFVRLRVDRDRRDTEAPGRAHDPAGDLPPVGNQYLGEQRRKPRSAKAECSRASSRGFRAAWYGASRKRVRRGRACCAG